MLLDSAKLGVGQRTFRVCTHIHKFFPDPTGITGFHTVAQNNESGSTEQATRPAHRASPWLLKLPPFVRSTGREVTHW
ncbi:ectomycorrhiza-regulated protein [Moniliophthora roreri]|nr:ectomycorrhiza-regulated protein [Moniliophthora roreri]